MNMIGTFSVLQNYSLVFSVLFINETELNEIEHELYSRNGENHVLGQRSVFI